MSSYKLYRFRNKTSVSLETYEIQSMPHTSRYMCLSKLGGGGEERNVPDDKSREKSVHVQSRVKVVSFSLDFLPPCEIVTVRRWELFRTHKRHITNIYKEI